VGEKLVVVGQGYVGLPLALKAAEAGFEVVGYDVNRVTVASLTAGRSHIDDISDSELQARLQRGYSATTDPSVIADAAILVVCVPTPLADTGGPTCVLSQDPRARSGRTSSGRRSSSWSPQHTQGPLKKSLRLSCSGTSSP